MPSNVKTSLIITCCAVLGVSLIAWAMQGAVVFYYPVAEIVQENNPSKFTNVRLSGYVKPGTIIRDRETSTIRFIAMDMEDKSIEIDVLHKGLEVPDMFKDHAEVIAEGSLQSNGEFESTFLMAKCPSKYETQYEAGDQSPHDYEGAYAEGKAVPASAKQSESYSSYESE